MTNMIRQHTEFRPSARSPAKPDQQAIYFPSTDLEPLSKGSVTNPMLIIVFNTYLIPRSPRAWVLAKTLPLQNVAL